MPDTTGLLVSLAISAVIGLAAIAGFAWLMSSVINNRDVWRSGGSAFTPLQELIQPKVVIPIHYNTFDLIAQDADAWAERVQQETDTKVVVLKPGEGYSL